MKLTLPYPHPGFRKGDVLLVNGKTYTIARVRGTELYLGPFTWWQRVFLFFRRIWRWVRC